MNSSNISILRYDPSNKAEWNDLVKSSAIGTFLHTRSYIDYHKSKFEDYSLLAYLDGQLVAVLPAHLIGCQLYSHNGLTYGGIVLAGFLSKLNIYNIVGAFLKHIYSIGIKAIFLTQLPSIYADTCHLQDLCQAYRIAEGSIISRQFASAIPFPLDLATWDHGKKWGLNKAKKQGFMIIESDSFQSFWREVLIPNLKDNYNTAPLHSEDEILWLSKNNHGKIRQFNIYLQDEIVGGITVYETNRVARMQYLSATPKGKSFHALNLLIFHLATDVFFNKGYFDMGSSYNQHNKTINNSLLYWKNSLGAKSYYIDTYKIESKNYSSLLSL